MMAVSLIVAVGLLATACLRTRSAALRHWMLAVALACAAAVPVLAAIVPAWNIAPRVAPSAPTAPRSAVTTVIAQGPVTAPDAHRERPSGLPDRIRAFPARQLLPAIWLAGAAVCLFVLVAGLGRLAWLASRSRPVRDGRWARLTDEISRRYGVRRPIRLLQSAHPTLLVTWGLVQPKIILPLGASDWPEDRVRIVLCHEMAHIRRGDWGAHMMAELLRAAYWFNPLLWIARSRLREDSEQACDNAVLHQGIAPAEYATHLLDLARDASLHRRAWISAFPAPAMVRPSSFERRVRAMLTTDIDRRPPTRLTRIVTSATVVGLAVLIVGFSAAAQSTATLSGSVVDPANSLIPGVTVTLIDDRSQAKHEVQTDESGHFAFVALPSGDYRIEAQLPGFKAFKGTVTLAGRDVVRKLQLTLGTVSESINVRYDPSDTRPASPPATATDRRAVRTSRECTATSTGGNIRPPVKLKNVLPQFPPALAGTGVKGVVILEGVIGTDGFIRDLKVLHSVHPDLDAAAVEAARQWEFGATLLNCVPVEVSITISVSFSEGQ